VDETYLTVAGVWRYLYRAIDQFGEVVEVWLSSRCDAIAATRFFATAMKATGTEPAEVVTDRSPVYPAGPGRGPAWGLPQRGAVRQQQGPGR
jgi:transposase-like protein